MQCHIEMSSIIQITTLQSSCFLGTQQYNELSLVLFPVVVPRVSMLHDSGVLDWGWVGVDLPSP